MTKIVIPYTRYSRAQAQHLAMEGYTPIYQYVGDDPYSYFEMLRTLWHEREDFILIEHDIIPWPGALATFDACYDMWCAFGYLYPPDGYITTAHGCIRFRTEIMDKIPDLFEIVEANDGRFFRKREEDTRHWKDLDGCVSPVLTMTLDRFVHQHNPPVVHTKVVDTSKSMLGFWRRRGE